MTKYQLITKFSEYNTSYDKTNAPETVLTAGSQNVMIDGRNGKVRSSPGYTRLGVANTTLYPIRNAKTWHPSKGGDLPLRMYNDQWEVYLETVDATIINAWTPFGLRTGMSATAIPRFDYVYDATEAIDVMVAVQADPNLYEWNGAVAVVASITATTITKAGTNTFGQSRFYNSRNKVVTCVRTGTDYTYTGGESTLTLTGIADTTGLIAGDILVQKMVTQTSKPLANRNNHTIATYRNQIFVGSDEDEVVYISKNTSYYDFTYSAARIAGEGGILTLTDRTKGFGILADTMVVFSGVSAAFKVLYTSITVGTTLTESLTALPLKIGVRQGAYNQETIVAFGNALMYLSNEPAVLMIETVAQADEPQLKSLSNPIKPDMDAEDFTSACATWYKNSYHLSAPANSHVYILGFIQDADSKLRRYWQPPQILPVRAFSVIDTYLHGHSNSVPETYKLFDGLSYTASDDSKLPIYAIAAMSYRSFGDRANMKDFDEIYVEGEISASTPDCLVSTNYDFGGHTQTIVEGIDGTDEGILEEFVGSSSLAQESLGTDSLGGLLNPPADARKFRVVFEEAKEDFHEMNFTVSTNDVDRYWSILAIGVNARISPRKDTFIRR